jgi:hypothetical protein
MAYVGAECALEDSGEGFWYGWDELRMDSGTFIDEIGLGQRLKMYRTSALSLLPQLFVPPRVWCAPSPYIGERVAYKGRNPRKP